MKTEHPLWWVLFLLLNSYLQFKCNFFAVQLQSYICISIFNSNPELMRITTWAIRIYFGAGFILGAQIACQQTFIAVGKAKISLFLALLRKVVLLVPLIYILPLFLEDKVFAVFLAEPIADLLATTTTIVLFSLEFKKILRQCRKDDAKPERIQQ